MAKKITSKNPLEDLYTGAYAGLNPTPILKAAERSGDDPMLRLLTAWRRADRESCMADTDADASRAGKPRNEIEIEKETKPYTDRERRLVDVISDTPARSKWGVVAKLQFAIEFSNFDAQWPDEPTISPRVTHVVCDAIRDLQRIIDPSIRIAPGTWPWNQEQV